MCLAAVLCVLPLSYVFQKKQTNRKENERRKFAAAALRPCFSYGNLAVLFTTPWGCLTKPRNLSSQIGVQLLKGWCETGFIRKHSYLITRYHAVLALTPVRLRIWWFMPQGRASCQNLGQRIKDFFFVVVMESLVFELQILFRVDSLCDFSAPGMGQGVKI